MCALEAELQSSILSLSSKNHGSQALIQRQETTSSAQEEKPNWYWKSPRDDLDWSSQDNLNSHTQSLQSGFYAYKTTKTHEEKPLA